MSPTLLHVLTRPVSLMVKGLGRAAWQTLILRKPSREIWVSTTTTTTTTMRQVVGVRWCSGPTTFRQSNFISGKIENNTEKDPLGCHPSPEPHQTDLQDTTVSQNFSLPSQQHRHQSDLLMDKIRSCDGALAAFDVYQRHSEVMDTKHCLALIRKLGELVNDSSEDPTRIIQEEDFKTLCGQLFTQCRRMDAEELVMVLKNLCRLEVPATSKLTQAVLQMIKDQINDLPMRHLIFLEFLLKKTTLTPLCDALLTAIPILMSNALAASSSHLTELSFSELSQAFVICCRGRVTGPGILLQEMYRRGSVSSVSVAMSLVWTLTRLSSPHWQRKLLSREEQLTREVIMKECLETLTQETNSLTPQQVDSTLSRLSSGHDLGDRCCYNERFLRAAASYICQHSLPFEKVAHAIRKMLSMNYLPAELVRHAAHLLLSRPEEVPHSRVGMLPIISSITAISMPPDDLKAVLDVVMTHKSLRMDSKEYYRKPLLILAIDLLSVDYHSAHLMDLLTCPDTLSMYMSKYTKENVNYRRLLEVDQCLGEVAQSPYRVPETFLEPGRKLTANQLPSKSTLKAMLLQLLQDPNCLISGVITQAGVYLDHLMVLDGKRTPVKLRSLDAPLMRNPTITSLALPPQATKVAIMDIGSSSTFRPTSTLKGAQRLRHRVLEAEGFKVVALLQSVIFQHQEEEKLLYVKRELSEAGVTLC